MDDIDKVDALETAKGLINKRLNNERRRVANGIGSRGKVINDWWMLRGMNLPYNNAQIGPHRLPL